jgi:pimeloyl-ACP methyl ester carboxylesterase
VAFITVADRKLEVERIAAGAPGRPVLVFLHEGLGSVSLWKDFPARVAHAAGCDVVVYSRHGYGRSDRLTGPHLVRYMHDQALHALPELLGKLDIRSPVLVGHSDGASIAIVHAGAGHPVEGLVLMAPHVIVEDLSVESIAAAKVAYETTDMPKKLGRHHDDPDTVFRAWNDIWLAPDFRSWNIEEYLAGIRCPVMVIQGQDDEYGTMEQVRRIQRQLPDVDAIELADCRHSPHRDQPDAVIEAIVRFVDRLTAGS